MNYKILINKIISAVEQRGTFRSIINDVITFYMEISSENKMEINDETIRNTFYNMMVEEVLTSEDRLIDPNSLEDGDTYVYLALSAQTILSSITYSNNYEGILLHNGSIVTESTCPQNYRALFKQLILLKNKMGSLNLNDKQLKMIKFYAVNNPKMIIPDDIESCKTPELMSLVSIITNMAIEISSINHFKEIIEDVIKFCLDAFKS